jgi:hypothetical protein
MLLAMDASGATVQLLPLGLGLLLYRLWGLWPVGIEPVLLDVTYPSVVAEMSCAELDFLRIPFNLGSESFWTSSEVGIGDVVHRDSCKWAALPLERAGDDEDDNGPTPDSSTVPNPEEEDNTTWRCWEHRSELCRISPSSEILALRIYSNQSNWC